MTFEEWQKTAVERDATGFSDIIENRFGYVPDDVRSIRMYAPGLIAALSSGQFFTHVDRSEYTGTLEAVERRLWDDYARHEVG
jgi:hypothetical protein